MLAWYAVSRVLVVLATLPAALHGDPADGPWPSVVGGNGIARALARWDGSWYLWVADRGYPSATEFTHHLSDVAFFPLYPGLIRATTFVTGCSTLTAALVIAALAGALASVLVWLVILRVAGRAVADRAVLLFVFFPGSFVLSMAYAEPLMIAATAACVLALLDRRWVLAGLAAALATASRPNALAIVVACAVVAIVELSRRRHAKPTASVVLALGGIGAFFLYLWIHTGRMAAWFVSENDAWHDHTSILMPLFERIGALFSHGPSLESGGLNDLIAVVGFVVVGVSLWALYRSNWPIAVRAYTAAALVIPTMSVAVGPRPRMLLAAFPMAGLAAQSERWYRPLLVVSVIGLIVMTVITSTSLAAVP